MQTNVEFGPRNLLLGAVSTLNQLRSTMDGFFNATGALKYDSQSAVQQLKYIGTGVAFDCTLRVAEVDDWHTEEKGQFQVSLLKGVFAKILYWIAGKSGSKGGFVLTCQPKDNKDLSRGVNWFAVITLHNFVPQGSRFMAKMIVPLHGYMLGYEIHSRRAEEVMFKIVELFRKEFDGMVPLTYGMRTWLYACLTGDIGASTEPFDLGNLAELHVFQRDDKGNIYFWVKAGDRWLQHWEKPIAEAAKLTF